VNEYIQAEAKRETALGPVHIKRPPSHPTPQSTIALTVRDTAQESVMNALGDSLFHDMFNQT
jgi:hypothetical protein